ncbi:MAG: DUF4278 domain-containing protein [Leptolyngbyaceae cyanobacterium SM1_4_3]|nr:DUF4278 domain-containing protein [Leptolyngbyaceae cyanobacterium SM1_4_3]
MIKYRGNAYEVPASIHSGSDSENQPKQKLIYRGQIYDYTPPSAIPEAFDPNATTVTLSYRGVTFERQIRSPKPYQPPRAINWRYRMLGG